MVSEAEVAQDEPLKTVEAAEHFLAFHAARRIAANRLCQAIERSLGGTADIEQATGLIPVEHVQIPGDVHCLLRRGPARLFLRPSHEDRDPLMRVQFHAEIDARIVEFLRAERIPGVTGRSVEDRVHFRLEGLERNVA